MDTASLVALRNLPRCDRRQLLTAAGGGLLASIVSGQSSPPAMAQNAYLPWVDLINLRPPIDLQYALKARFALFGVPANVVHKLEDAYGPINLDYYPVNITALPSGFGSAAQLLATIRVNLSYFLDTTI